jgi:hypothetical protein
MAADDVIKLVSLQESFGNIRAELHPNAPLAG